MSNEKMPEQIENMNNVKLKEGGNLATEPKENQNANDEAFPEEEDAFATEIDNENFFEEEPMLNANQPLFTEEEFTKLLANEEPYYATTADLTSEGSFQSMNTNHSMVVLMNEMDVKKDAMSTSESSKRKGTGKSEDTASSRNKRPKNSK